MVMIIALVFFILLLYVLLLFSLHVLRCLSLLHRVSRSSIWTYLLYYIEIYNGTCNNIILLPHALLLLTISNLGVQNYCACIPSLQCRILHPFIHLLHTSTFLMFIPYHPPPASFLLPSCVFPILECPEKGIMGGDWERDSPKTSYHQHYSLLVEESRCVLRVSKHTHFPFSLYHSPNPDIQANPSFPQSIGPTHYSILSILTINLPHSSHTTDSSCSPPAPHDINIWSSSHRSPEIIAKYSILSVQKLQRFYDVISFNIISEIL